MGLIDTHSTCQVDTLPPQLGEPDLNPDDPWSPVFLSDHGKTIPCAVIIVKAHGRRMGKREAARWISPSRRIQEERGAREPRIGQEV